MSEMSRSTLIRATLEYDSGKMKVTAVAVKTTNKKIAEKLYVSINTVKSHLRRSIEWMREQCAGENHGI